MKHGSAVFEDAVTGAEVVVVGPAPPLRGGIAAHTARLVEHLRGQGVDAITVSYERLYPQMLFPGRSQRVAGGGLRPAAAPATWTHEVLDTLDPRTWKRAGRALAASEARILFQWWHPIVAPALLAATDAVAPGRLVALCHNTLPHERVPGAALAARRLLARCGRVVCFSRAEASVAARFVGPSRSATITTAPLPCLVPAAAFAHAKVPLELAALPAGSRVFVVAGHLRSYKAIPLVLRAWRAARPGPEARLVVVGESYLRGRERREVAELAAMDRSIIVIDRYVEDEELVSCLTFAEALVVFHDAASQSGLLPIALALDLPCIVSDAGGLAEQAGRGGDRSRFEVVTAGDGAALAAVFAKRFAAKVPPPRRVDVDAPPNRAASASRTRTDELSADWQLVVEAIGIPPRP